MSNISHNQNYGRNLNDGAGALGFFGLMLALVGVFWVGLVFEASLAAGFAVVAAILVSVGLAVAVYIKQQRVTLALVLMALAGLWAAVAGLVVFDNHWLSFTAAAGVLDALFVGALIAGAWSALNGVLKLIAALFAAALLTATIVLPRPAGGEGPFDTNEEWRVNVDVADTQEHALPGALVLCGAVMSWETTLGLAQTNAQWSDRDGRVPPWEFSEDPRLKIVICNAWKDANEGNAGYAPQSQVVVSPTGGGAYDLHFKLSENAHPDTAFLTVDLQGAALSKPWFTLRFELWAGEPPEPGQTSAQPLQSKAWGELAGKGFTLDGGQAAGDLYLRYIYEGPGGVGLVPPYAEARTAHIGAIEPGTRKDIALRIPSNEP